MFRPVSFRTIGIVLASLFLLNSGESIAGKRCAQTNPCFRGVRIACPTKIYCVPRCCPPVCVTVGCPPAITLCQPLMVSNPCVETSREPDGQGSDSDPMPEISELPDPLSDLQLPPDFLEKLNASRLQSKGPPHERIVRTWKHRDGRTVTAIYVDSSETVVRLANNGKLYEVQLTVLSTTDQQFVVQQQSLRPVAIASR